MSGDQFKPNIYSKGLWEMFYPGISNIAGSWNTLSGTPGYGLPQAPTMPSMSGVLSGVPMYGIPNTNSIMPTKSWFNKLSPEVKEGVWAPYEDVANQLGERMGATGVLGSERGGMSGAAGAAFGDYYADAAKDYGTQLWSMSAPGAMAGWQANLARNQLGYQNRLTERQTDYQNTLNQANQNYAAQMQGWGLPFQMAMNYNNLAPSGAYHSDSGGTLSSVMGAASSILGPVGMGVGFGLGGPAGAAIGGGLGGGKGSSIQPYNNMMFNPMMGGNIGSISPFGTFGR